MVKPYRPRHAYPEFAEAREEYETLVARILRHASHREEQERAGDIDPYSPPDVPPPGWPVE